MRRVFLFIETNTFYMNIQTVNSDIKKMEKALKQIEQTENYMHFKKAHLISELCEQINALKEKRDKQIAFWNSLWPAKASK